jgi:hypothetical protein
VEVSGLDVAGPGQSFQEARRHYEFAWIRSYLMRHWHDARLRERGRLFCQMMCEYCVAVICTIEASL